MGYKYDMHTHSSGSFDCELDIWDTIEKLRDMGYSGMVITDHDNYKGFEQYFDDGYGYEDFAIIKGIEISSDRGHLIAIPPDIENDYLIDTEGMDIFDVIKEAKRHGYLVGLSHPYCPTYGALNSNNPNDPIDLQILEEVDFLECYNYGVSYTNNRLAEEVADLKGIAKTAGSDSHVIEAVGNAYTEFNMFLDDNESFVENFHDALIGYGKIFEYFD